MSTYDEQKAALERWQAVHDTFVAPGLMTPATSGHSHPINGLLWDNCRQCQADYKALPVSTAGKHYLDGYAHGIRTILEGQTIARADLIARARSRGFLISPETPLTFTPYRHGGEWHMQAYLEVEEKQ